MRESRRCERLCLQKNNAVTIIWHVFLTLLITTLYHLRFQSKYFFALPITLFAQGDPICVSVSLRGVPSTPVRTGRPFGLQPKVATGTFDPCSHRGTRRQQTAQAAPILRPLFAQGDRWLTNQMHVTLPSTPVRTGGPGAVSTETRLRPFDPCSHRGTTRGPISHNQSSFRPLFAQGVFLHNIFVTGNPAFMRLLRPHFPGLTSKLSKHRTPVRPSIKREWQYIRNTALCDSELRWRTQRQRGTCFLGSPFGLGFTSDVAMMCGSYSALCGVPGRPRGLWSDVPHLPFDPCSHRETVEALRERIHEILRPLFAQGDRTSCTSCRLTHPSNPVRTGRPRHMRRRTSWSAFDPCVHRATWLAYGLPETLVLPITLRSQGTQRPGFSDPAALPSRSCS